MPSTPPTGRPSSPTPKPSDGDRHRPGDGNRPVAGRPLQRSQQRARVLQRAGRRGAATGRDDLGCRTSGTAVSAPRGVGCLLGTIGNRACRHNPHRASRSPTARLPPQPEPDLTEIGGSWSPTWCQAGRRMVGAAPVRYPSDAMQMAGGSVLLTDYSQPGRRSPQQHRTHALVLPPLGACRLNHTSIAIPWQAIASHLRRLQQPVIVVDPQPTR